MKRLLVAAALVAGLFGGSATAQVPSAYGGQSYGVIDPAAPTVINSDQGAAPGTLSYPGPLAATATSTTSFANGGSVNVGFTSAGSSYGGSHAYLYYFMDVGGAAGSIVPITVTATGQVQAAGDIRAGSTSATARLEIYNPATQYEYQATRLIDLASALTVAHPTDLQTVNYSGVFNATGNTRYTIYMYADVTTSH